MVVLVISWQTQSSVVVVPYCMEKAWLVTVVEVVEPGLQEVPVVPVVDVVAEVVAREPEAPTPEA